MNDLVFFVMPAYNEAENIENVVSEWHKLCEIIVSQGDDAKLVIANDGSKDSTYEKLLSLQSHFPYLYPLDKPNSGHGSTILFLYQYAIEHNASFVFQTDSDGQTCPDEFWVMWENRSKYDFQIGSRKDRKDGLSRIFVTKTLRFVIWIMLHVWVNDANTPFRLMNTKRLKEILKVIPKDFFLANVAISAIAVKWEESLAWYPITFRPRQGGVNSINMRRIFKIGVQSIQGFRKLNEKIYNANKY